MQIGPKIVIFAQMFYIQIACKRSHSSPWDIERQICQFVVAHKCIENKVALISTDFNAFRGCAFWCGKND